MVKVETIASANVSVSSSSRVSAHTHITGLGLDENGDAIVPMVGNEQAATANTSGLVGQTAAREALGIVSDLVHSQRLAGRALLLVGPPGTGKVRRTYWLR
ncbi:MAG: DNA helicase TIP49 (TBP-interacting protein) [Bacillariaceae sp.]|jgi:DNA helicase TIP49 (TBP-interacting protein)